MTATDSGMFGMFVLEVMWCGYFLWWDSSQCATGPFSVCQLLPQLLLMLWGQLPLRDHRAAATTHLRCWYLIISFTTSAEQQRALIRVPGEKLWRCNPLFFVDKRGRNSVSLSNKQSTFVYYTLLFQQSSFLAYLLAFFWAFNHISVSKSSRKS